MASGPKGDVGANLEVRLLGPLEVLREGAPLPLGAPKSRALFGYLALHAGRVIPDHRLVDVLWGEEPPASAAHALQVYVGRLRDALAPARRPGEQSGLLRTRRPGYELALARDQVDVHRFVAMVELGRRDLAAGRADAAATALRAADGLWRGPALADLGALVASPEAERLGELRWSAVEDRIEAELALGRHRELVPELAGLTREHPLRERLCGQLMVSLYRCGRQADALQALHALRGRLDEDGLAPCPELRDLEVAVLRQDDRLAAPARSAEPTASGPTAGTGATAGQGPDAGEPPAGETCLVWPVTVVHVAIEAPEIEPRGPALDADVAAALAELPERVAQRLKAVGATTVDGGPGRVTAVFGLSRPREDDAERALRGAGGVAHEAGRHARELGEVWGLAPPLIRTGVATGLPPMDEAGRQDLVPLRRDAARLAAAAAPGETRTDETTGALLRRPVSGVDAGGPGDAPRARAATSTAVSAARPSHGPHAEVPLVGREAELAAGLTVLEAARAGTGGVLWITGEVGVGKSRLLDELRRHRDQQRVCWLQGNCLPYPGMAHWPIREIVHGWLGTTVQTREPLVRARLRVRLDQLPASDAARARLGLAALLGLLRDEGAPGVGSAPPPEVLEGAVATAVEHLLAGLAGQAPLVVAVEDLHWADAGSLRMLEALLPIVESTGLALLVSQRPERDHPSWRLRESAQRTLPHRITDVALAPLPRGLDDELLTSLTSGRAIPPRLRARLLAAAEGNPFYLEELVRTIDQTEDPSARIPPTVEQVLRSRVATLSVPAQRLLTVAAVLGRQFDLGLLLAVAGLDAVPIEVLSELNAHGWIAQIRGWPAAEYQFRHVLSQEAAYRGLWPQRRRELHQRTATLLAERAGAHPGRNHDTLAWHWQHAGDDEQAMRHHLLAAREAFTVHALDVATHHFRQGLDAAGRLGSGADPHTRNDLLLGLGQVGRLSGTGDPETLLNEALREAIRTGDTGIEWCARYELGYWLGYGRGRQPEARAAFRAAAVAAQGCGEALGRVRALAKVSLLLAADLDLVAALAQAQKALEEAEVTGDERAVASALDARKLSALYLGELSVFEALLPGLEAVLRRQDDLWTLQFVLAEAAIVAAAAGRWEEARARLDAADAANQRCADRVCRPFVLTTRTAVEHRRGAFGKALAAGRQAVTPEDCAWWTSWARTDLGALLLQLNDLPGAVEQLRLASNLSMFPAQQVRSLAHLAKAQWQVGDRASALVSLEQAEGILAGVKAPPGHTYLFGADAALACADVRLANGQPADAEHLLQPVVTAAGRTGWHEVDAHGLLLTARCRLATGDQSAARTLAARALAGSVKNRLPTATWTAHALLAGLAEPEAGHLDQACRAAVRLADSLPDRSRREFLHYALGEIERLAGPGRGWGGGAHGGTSGRRSVVSSFASGGSAARESACVHEMPTTRGRSAATEFASDMTSTTPPAAPERRSFC